MAEDWEGGPIIPSPGRTGVVVCWFPALHARGSRSLAQGAQLCSPVSLTDIPSQTRSVLLQSLHPRVANNTPAGWGNVTSSCPCAMVQLIQFLCCSKKRCEDVNLLLSLPACGIISLGQSPRSLVNGSKGTHCSPEDLSPAGSATCGSGRTTGSKSRPRISSGPSCVDGEPRGSVPAEQTC